MFEDLQKRWDAAQSCWTGVSDPCSKQNLPLSQEKWLHQHRVVTLNFYIVCAQAGLIFWGAVTMIKLGSKLRDRFGLWVFSWEFLNEFSFCAGENLQRHLE